MICWSLYFDVPIKMAFGCYSSADGKMLSVDYREQKGGNSITRNIFQPFLDPDGTVCFNPRIHKTFLGLLLALQGLTCMWFALIIRVAWNVMNGKGADDARSDGEVEAEDDLEETIEEASALMPTVESNVGVESLYLKTKSSPFLRSRRPGSSMGPISIATHPDKKELLGRIGCDRPT